MADWCPEMCRLSIEELQTRWLLLLTGTPIQNNMKELFSIMNLVKPDEFYNCDAFLTRFGNPPALPSSPEQLQDLQVRATQLVCVSLPCADAPQAAVGERPMLDLLA